MSDRTATAKPASAALRRGHPGLLRAVSCCWSTSPTCRAVRAVCGDGIRTPEERLAKLEELRANEQKHRQSYAWIDQSAGVVQLPIDRAMELTVQQYNLPR
jgi:hypothetical protein